MYYFCRLWAVISRDGTSITLTGSKQRSKIYFPLKPKSEITHRSDNAREEKPEEEIRSGVVKHPKVSGLKVAEKSDSSVVQPVKPSSSESDCLMSESARGRRFRLSLYDLPSLSSVP
jgi:hypothetical protein